MEKSEKKKTLEKLFIFTFVTILITSMFFFVFRHKSILFFNPNKTRLLEGSFFSGRGQLDAPSYFKKNKSNISITLQIVKQPFQNWLKVKKMVRSSVIC